VSASTFLLLMKVPERLNIFDGKLFSITSQHGMLGSDVGNPAVRSRISKAKLPMAMAGPRHALNLSSINSVPLSLPESHLQPGFPSSTTISEMNAAHGGASKHKAGSLYR